MKKTIFGIILFLVQISIALFYNSTIDLICVIALALLTFGYVLYKFFSGKYNVA